MPRNIDFSKQSVVVRLASHAIGLDHKRPYRRYGKFFYRPYRNRYLIHEKSPDWSLWMALVENRLAAHGEMILDGQGKHTTFYLTREGLDWLGRQLHITIHDEED